jgi:hypothetical protein
VSESLQKTSITLRHCEGSNCNAEISLKYARYCDPCRSKARRRKKIYIPNDLIDQQLRTIYRETPDKKRNAGQSVKKLAARFKWTVSAMRQRARALGLARTKDIPWSNAEIRILEQFAWMSEGRIQIKLKAAGFSRTKTAIHVKLSRTAARQNTPYFTMNALAMCFGVDGHVITRWVRLGYLKYKLKGSERHEGNGGDMQMIHENDVRKFIFARPLEFDIRKVDQLWFLDLVTNGKICGGRDVSVAADQEVAA